MSQICDKSFGKSMLFDYINYCRSLKEQKCEMLTLKNSLSPFNGQWVGLIFSFSFSLNGLYLNYLGFIRFIGFTLTIF